MNIRPDAELPQIAARPLTPDAFRPFGCLLTPEGGARRTPFPTAMQANAVLPRPALWVSHVAVAQSLPLRLRQMERHRHAAQSFMPLAAGRWLVIVAPGALDGGPDPAGALAFLAGPSVGVCYHPGTWHGSLTVLDAPADFVVLMSDAGHPDDDEFQPVSPFLVTA